VLLGLRLHDDPLDACAIVVCRALATQHVESRWLDAAAGVHPAVTVGEQRVAVGVEEVRRTELAQLGCERGNDGQTLRERRRPGIPRRREALEERTERILGVGVTDRPESLAGEP